MSPTIVAVPGAWHIIESFAPVKKIFTARNYDFVSQNAPGVLVKNASESTAEIDAESLRTNLLLPLIEEGKDVAVLMHSYGGVYGSQAVKGLSKREREKAGKKGGVTALIYVSAVTPMAGKTTLDMMGTDRDNLPPWVDYNKSTGFVNFSGAKEVMYHNISDDDAAHYLSLLKDQALNSMDTPVSYSPLDDPNFEGTASYVLCGADRVVPLAGQETYAAIGKISRTILVEDATHAFFASAPEGIVDAVIELLES
ncbi:hypothetical protein NW762_010699 [Fusarium torreyae]|uniref:AB hydrolase-1 domain-containing protein n=1 Tax=Fusarium torreyae TaxID=1237075 RepID=A0A9W8RQU0_9HYPO|nr:hypothetical protein NW762_010699 [Fusarium torreyae]